MCTTDIFHWGECSFINVHLFWDFKIRCIRILDIDCSTYTGLNLSPPRELSYNLRVMKQNLILPLKSKGKWNKEKQYKFLIKTFLFLSHLCLSLPSTYLFLATYSTITCFASIQLYDVLVYVFMLLYWSLSAIIFFLFLLLINFTK